MRRFIKTVVPADGYEEVKKVGEKYVVHLDGVADETTQSIVCYECMTDDVPDMAVLGEELKVWKAYVAERELETAKSAKLAELDAYDQSDAVNGFEVTIGGESITKWLDPNKRNNATRAIESAKKLGVASIDFALGDLALSLPTEEAEIDLAKVEIYAVRCTNVTERHRAAIQQLTTVADVDAYDFTTGYPDRPTFSV